MSEEQRVRNAVLDVLITSLQAQLQALRRLRRQADGGKPTRKRSRMSQVDLVEDILDKAEESLHVNEIIDRVEQAHGVRLDRESIVSALTKRVKRGDRFVRTGRNRFALKGGTQ